MGVQEQLADAFLKGMNQFHRAMLTLSGGRWGNSFSGMTTVELHTVGRKSGKRRSVMLTAPVREPDRVVLVASKGGDERDPEWYKNLVANPDVELTIGGSTRAMAARTATAAERAELWPRIVAAYGAYGSYQRRTSREIPVVILEPR
jgi:deazaflavin-dependent oxidoreductase (nitroreductase family)